MKIKYTPILILVASVAVVTWTLLELEQFARANSQEAECKSFRQTTGYWVKFDKLNGCFVLIDNQYLVEKSLLTPTSRPALDPAVVGDEAAYRGQ